MYISVFCTSYCHAVNEYGHRKVEYTVLILQWFSLNMLNNSQWKNCVISCCTVQHTGKYNLWKYFAPIYIVDLRELMDVNIIVYRI